MFFCFFCYSYDLDPNDGYASRVPFKNYHHPVTTVNRSPTLTKAKNPYLNAYKTIQIVSPTPVPSPAYHSTTETPQIQINSHEPAVNYQYETYLTTTAIPTITYANPSSTPSFISTTTAATRQHLTETTQIRAPTEATYHPVAHDINNEHGHYNVYKSSANKLNSAPKYKTTVLNRVVPIVDEPHFIVRPSTPLVHQPVPLPPPLPVIDYAINASSITTLLRKLQDSNQLPQTITPNNIDNSIRTLVKILNNLKHTQSVADTPSQHYVENNDDGHDSSDDDYSDTDTKTNGGI